MQFPSSINGVFGAPFDPPYSPERQDLKNAYIVYSQKSSESIPLFQDPYDYFKEYLTQRDTGESDIEWMGKIPTPNWLKPKPLPSETDFLDLSVGEQFLEENGCWKYALEVARFYEKQIFPKRPVMIGVDHSATGGLLKALAKRYNNLNLVVLDAHFDAMKTRPPAPLLECGNAEVEVSFYHCGNFLGTLMESGIIRPENIWVLGCQSQSETDGLFDREMTSAPISTEENLKKDNNNVNLIPKDMVSKGQIDLALNGPTYVSIDMDVGSQCSVYSARFMNCYGISADALISALKTLSACIQRSSVPLIGFDIMEIDVHFLEIAEDIPVRDQTLDLAVKAAEILLGNDKCAVSNG